MRSSRSGRNAAIRRQTVPGFPNVRRHIHRVDESRGLFQEIRFFHPVYLRDEAEVLPRRRTRAIYRFGGDDDGSQSDFEVLLPAVHAEDLDLARGREQDTAEEAQECGLSRAVRADGTEDFARGYFERGVLECQRPAVLFAEIRDPDLHAIPGGRKGESHE
jgi:hypothetical protein